MKKYIYGTIVSAIITTLVLAGLSFSGANFSRVKTWNTADTLTASDLNAEYDNILNNFDPDGIDDASTNVAAMQATADPYPGASESLATSGRGELQRLRYVVDQLGGEAQWYIDPDGSMADVFTNTATFAGKKTFSNNVIFTKGADVASATALPIITDGNYFDVTGTTTVTSIDTVGVGVTIRLHFDDAVLLTHDATDLVLPGAANITTAAGDEFEFTEYAAGDWRCTGYTLASGRSIIHRDAELQTDTAASSGTTVDFTSIPSWVTRITIMFESVTWDGTQVPLLQIGDSGGFETSGYTGSVSSLINTASVAGAQHGEGFLLSTSNADDRTYNGIIELVLKNAATFTWAMQGDLGLSTGLIATLHSAGFKSLSAALTQIRITTAATADDFDGAGSINVIWE